MNKIKFNQTEFEVESFNRSTSFNDGAINSTGFCTLITTNTSALSTLAAETITEIQIKHDDTVIYEVSELTAHIDNINEYLSGDRMTVNVSIKF